MHPFGAAVYEVFIQTWFIDDVLCEIILHHSCCLEDLKMWHYIERRYYEMGMADHYLENSTEAAKNAGTIFTPLHDASSVDSWTDPGRKRFHECQHKIRKYSSLLAGTVCQRLAFNYEDPFESPDMTEWTQMEVKPAIDVLERLLREY